MEGTANDAAEGEQHVVAARIEFPQLPEEEQEQSRLELERQKHKARAEKFGTAYVEPAKRSDLRLDARKEKFNRPGFATGIDVFSEEEAAKRAQRAARFGLPKGSGLAWQGPQPAEDEEKRRQRAARFGTEYKPKDETGLMDVDLFEERHDPGVAVPRRPDAVHIYGVDLLSTRDLLQYWADYGPKFVEWINDSSANVLFADAATAQRAVAGMGKPLPPDEAPEQLGINAADPAAIQFLWHKGEDFVKAGTAVPLIFRIATVDDVKPADRVPSRRLWLSAGGGGQGRQRRRGGGEGEEDGETQARGRGRQRYKVRRGGGRSQGWQHDDRGNTEGGGGGGGGDVEAGQRPERRPRGRAQGKRRRRQGGGDVEMMDVDVYEDEGGNEGGGTRFRRDDDGEQGAAAAELPGPAREQVTYGDL